MHAFAVLTQRHFPPSALLTENAITVVMSAVYEFLVDNSDCLTDLTDRCLFIANWLVCCSCLPMVITFTTKLIHHRRPCNSHSLVIPSTYLMESLTGFMKVLTNNVYKLIM
jgi:hypothetical protein